MQMAMLDLIRYFFAMLRIPCIAKSATARIDITMWDAGRLKPLIESSPPSGKQGSVGMKFSLMSAV
jgi:hypothetical protein